MIHAKARLHFIKGVGLRPLFLQIIVIFPPAVLDFTP